MAPNFFDIAKTKNKLSLMSNFFIGFIIHPNVKADKFIADVEELLKQYKRYKLSYNLDDTILFGDLPVPLSGTIH